nr:hypothetical protein [Tanacetum cinerariifolium]
CALLRQELEEILVTHSPDFQNTSEPSNASTNVVNAPREPYNSLNDSPSIFETSSQSPPNINHCCYECGDPLDGIFCKRCTCKSCGTDADIGYNCPSKVLVISFPEPCNNQTIDELPQALLIFHPTFHSEAESPFTLDSTPTYVDESPNVFNPPPQPHVYPCEFCGKDAYFGHYCTPQAPFIYSEACYNQEFNFPQNFQNVPQQYPCCDDCGEEANSLIDNIVSELPSCSAIIPSETVDSLIMEDEHLDTIPATKSDEFIKSSVENLVPIPSESEDESECDVPDCDDSQTTKFSTFSNPLLDDSTSSDDESSHEEDIHKMSFKTYSNPLFDLDEEIISSEFNPIHNEDLEINEADYDPEEDIHLVKRLLYDNSSPRPSKEIDLSFNSDDPLSPGIEEDDDDSKRNIPILEELLDNYSLSLPASESYHFDIPSPYRPPAKPPDGKTGTLSIKMMGDVSDQTGFEAFQPLAECSMIINGKNTPVLDVPLFHFYPP